jgi:hypothetical protein
MTDNTSMSVIKERQLPRDINYKKYPATLNLLFNAADKAFALSECLYSQPLHWNRKERKVLLVPKSRIHIWEITIVLLLFQGVFIPSIYLIFGSNCSGPLSLQDKLMLGGTLTYCIQILAFSWIFLFRSDETREGINSLLKILDETAEGLQFTEFS